MFFWILLASEPLRAAPADSLVRAYPEALAAVEGQTLVWRGGNRMDLGVLHEDIPEERLLQVGSISDQLRQPYLRNMPPTLDAGRIRNRAFFDTMYGDCRKGEVERHLVHVAWLPRHGGHSVTITSVNGIDRHLAAVSDELDQLPAGEMKYLAPLGGTYLCRNVADTGQTSMHGWGAAIDINANFSDYWLWQRHAGKSAAYVNRIPADIVAAFERHGFIWGGRWAHFDTMHFEYRPELLGTDPAVP